MQRFGDMCQFLQFYSLKVSIWCEHHWHAEKLRHCQSNLMILFCVHTVIPPILTRPPTPVAEMLHCISCAHTHCCFSILTSSVHNEENLNLKYLDSSLHKTHYLEFSFYLAYLSFSPSSAAQTPVFEDFSLSVVKR